MSSIMIFQVEDKILKEYETIFILEMINVSDRRVKLPSQGHKASSNIRSLSNSFMSEFYSPILELCCLSQ